MDEIQFYDPILGQQYKNIIQDIEVMFKGKQNATELPGDAQQNSSLDEL